MHAPTYRTCMDAEPTNRTARRIVLLEQDEYIASLLHMLLNREGFEIVALASDEQAKNYLHSITPPDLIFINGSWIGNESIDILAGFAQRIEWQRVPMILLLGYYDAEKIEQAMNLGITDYLLQPFEPGELLDIIQRYI